MMDINKQKKAVKRMRTVVTGSKWVVISWDADADFFRTSGRYFYTTGWHAMDFLHTNKIRKYAVGPTS